MDQLSRRDLLKRALQGSLGLAALSSLQLTAMSKALAAQQADGLEKHGNIADDFL